MRREALHKTQYAMEEAEAPDREKPQGSRRVNSGTAATPAVPVLTYFRREWGGTEPRQSWLHLNFLLLVPRPENRLVQQSQGALGLG